MGANILFATDRRAATITEVHDDHIVVKLDDTELTYRFRKAAGRWKNTAGNGLCVGRRENYYDLSELGAKVGDTVRYHMPGSPAGDLVTIGYISPKGTYYGENDNRLSDYPYWELIRKSPAGDLSVRSIADLLLEVSGLVTERGHLGVSDLTIRTHHGATFGFRNGKTFMEWGPYHVNRD